VTDYIQITTKSLAVTRRQLVAVANIESLIEGVANTVSEMTMIVLKNGTKLYPYETYDQLVSAMLGYTNIPLLSPTDISEL